MTDSRRRCHTAYHAFKACLPTEFPRLVLFTSYYIGTSLTISSSYQVLVSSVLEDYTMSKFRIQVKNLRGLPIIKRKPMEGKPRLYIALSIDETQKHTRPTEQTQTGSLRWEQFLEFSSTTPDPESNLRIQLFRSHSIKKAEIIGSIERRMGDILAHGSGKDNVISIQYNDRLPGNTVLELTICVFGLEDLQLQARAIKEDVNHAAERIDSSEPSDVVDRVTGAIKIAQDTLDPWKTLLDRIDIIVKITERLAQVNLIVKCS
ncbi:hypothetical protein M422DRAFT_67883 [Sphaerobolus stellatus SS14]|uniref:C2 domain-containing protein n=1 Tax=Sphaerobolus stellatus (strain SS14) TaxID=990650 RepID=A0A0C9VYB8_SPHS4|nr:hypothetical protein M422DRAFT_67883 [Sphaerobolus stellatus SS14]